MIFCDWIDCTASIVTARRETGSRLPFFLSPVYSRQFACLLTLLLPNVFGLHDMHGNVMEWCIDGYTEDGYTARGRLPPPLSVADAIFWAETFDNRTVRGGSWQDSAEQLRCTARLGSADEDWKACDPCFPRSPWWYTDDPARGVGFRIFRSYQAFDDELIGKFWDIDNEDIDMDVKMRLTEGRGVIAPIDPSLAEDISRTQSHPRMEDELWNRH